MVWSSSTSLLTEPASLHIDQRGMQLSSAYANSALRTTFFVSVLICAARSASDQLLPEYPLSTSLDARLIPKMIQLVHDEHRLGLGNLMSRQLESVLLPDDRAEDIRQSILHFSGHLGGLV